MASNPDIDNYAHSLVEGERSRRAKFDAATLSERISHEHDVQRHARGAMRQDFVPAERLVQVVDHTGGKAVGQSPKSIGDDFESSQTGRGHTHDR